MTNKDMMLIASRYDTQTADAMRRACGVFSRRQWDSRTITGEEYDDYRRRLAETYQH